MFFVGVGTGVTVASVGAVVSITNVGTFKTEEIFPAESFTVIVQLEYVPATSVLKVIVLFPLVADVVAEEQEPPYVIVPASVEENVMTGVVLLVGVETGVTIASVGATLSIVNDGTLTTEEIFPAASVTVIVQLEYVPAASAENVTVLFPDVADVVAEEQEPPYVIVPASVEENVITGVVLLVGVVTGVTMATVGAVVSMTNVGIDKTAERFPAASRTRIVQVEYVPAASVLKVIVLFPDVADVVAEEQEPPYTIVPASVDENVYDGVVFFVGVGTGVTVASVGAVVSIVNDGILKTDEIFPAASITVIVQSEYVPAASVENVIVLLPLVADVVADEHEPPYVIVPASVVENVMTGVVLLVGVTTGVTMASVGAVVSITNVGTVNTADVFPAASRTRIVQVEYVPAASVLNVIVLFPLVVDVVAEEQAPP